MTTTLDVRRMTLDEEERAWAWLRANGVGHYVFAFVPVTIRRGWITAHTFMLPIAGPTRAQQLTPRYRPIDLAGSDRARFRTRRRTYRVRIPWAAWVAAHPLPTDGTPRDEL